MMARRIRRSAMSVRIVTAREMKGSKWAEEYPGKADELWVIARSGAKRKKKRIGPPTPENWARAERKRDEWLLILEKRASDLGGIAAPAFAELAAAFLERGMPKRAEGTIRKRRGQVDAMKEYFGDTRLDRIGVRDLSRFWAEFVEEGGLDWRTGTSYLDCLAGLFKFASREGHDVANPVPAAKKEIIGAISNTAEFRSRNDENRNPLTVEELRLFLPRLSHCAADIRIGCLLMYECGLRMGEMLGARWGDLWWGKDGRDTARHIHIQRARTGSVVGLPKSGRSRKVAVSQRLRHVLLARYLELGRPADFEYVVSSPWPEPYREELRRLCKEAGIHPHRPKDFRDTFASLLVTNGIVLKWISRQLGHASVRTTEAHYAAWMDEEGYRNPWQVAQGQVPTDLFAEVDLWVAPKAPLRAPKLEKAK
jgi:integrase